jgi:hypothetical protein
MAASFRGSQVPERQTYHVRIEATVGEIFDALGRTLAFRRWPSSAVSVGASLPDSGTRYRFQTGGIRRAGRIVEVIRPVSITLKETLNDPPCGVVLTMRWRIEPGTDSSCSVRLSAEYRLNHASRLRARHWDRRLRLHFQNQFSHLGDNVRRLCGSRISARQNVI